jgi:NADPH:quinone reductase-like Zn-dependent oxidoreductase
MNLAFLVNIFSVSKLSSASSIYATASSQEKLDFCTQTLGATAGINYKTQNFADEIQKLTNGKGVDIVIDFVGQNYFDKNLKVAAKDGQSLLLFVIYYTRLLPHTKTSFRTRAEQNSNSSSSSSSSSSSPLQDP